MARFNIRVLYRMERKFIGLENGSLRARVCPWMCIFSIRLLNLSADRKYQSFLPILGSLTRSSFPLLEEISLQFNRPVWETDPKSIDMLMDAPKLRHVSIVADQSITRMFLLPVEQLTSLKTIEPDEELLHRCKGLVHLDFRRSRQFHPAIPSFYPH
ncbi:hypothetical protein BT96DRAFT_233919 [Gymnopus androsaceus JB14]|uniref:F-box domain-containing protein n=1 Tax=Gymnopus androsaceus JB14 TaxID=1447944 RepID=A0A6A4GAM8_9AGAR|nr:hypothetical protein BT96DRAFT_233919 [Gymnopus androsaceus JB14]